MVSLVSGVASCPVSYPGGQSLPPTADLMGQLETLVSSELLSFSFIVRNFIVRLIFIRSGNIVYLGRILRLTFCIGWLTCI